ncbi:MAG: MFS transporter permease [Desulfobacterales bacterium]|jgi:hypothetical protein
MAKKRQQIVIPKEKAVFWLDKNGHWQNENGKFQHKRIIDYFHSCIKRDRHGYYLAQANDNYQEKVYFYYEDQALFVIDMIQGNDVTLVLNTKRRVKLKPKKLFIKGDSLYMHMEDEIIKFSEHGLMKIANLLEDENDQLYIRFKNRRYRISNMK